MLCKCLKKIESFVRRSHWGCSCVQKYSHDRNFNKMLNMVSYYFVAFFVCVLAWVHSCFYLFSLYFYWIYLQFCVLSCFFSERSEAEGRASLFLRPSSFFFARELGWQKWRKNFDDHEYHKKWHFFYALKYAVKWHFFLRLEICGKMTQLFLQSFCTENDLKSDPTFSSIFLHWKWPKKWPYFFFNLFALKMT